MAKLNDKQAILAITGGALVLCLAAGGGIYWAYDLVAQEEAAIEVVESKIDAANQKIAKIPKLEEDVILLRENVDHYVKILPNETQINDFVKTISRFAGQSEIVIKQLQDQAPGKRGKFDHYSYNITATGSVWQFMRFMNLFENFDRFVSIKAYNLKQERRRGNAPELAGGDEIYTFSVTVETYVYGGGKNKQNQVAIQNYATRRDALRETIDRFAQSIQLEKYEFKDASGRRDVFVDPRQGGDSINSRPLDLQKELIDKFTAQVEELTSIFEHSQDPDLTYLEQAELEEKLKALLDEVGRGVDEVAMKNLVTYPPFVSRWNSQVLMPLRRISDEAGGIQAADPRVGRYLTAEQMESVYETMLADVRNGALERARDRHEDARDRLAVGPDDARYQWVEKITELRLIIDHVIEFSKIPLDIKGVVVNEGGRSGLLVNGEVIEEGDFVNGDLLLKSVAVERATFIYKGFAVVKTW